MADDTTDKSGGKWDTIYPYGALYLEIMIILLTKMVAVYVGSFKIDFWTLGFK